MGIGVLRFYMGKIYTTNYMCHYTVFIQEILNPLKHASENAAEVKYPTTIHNHFSKLFTTPPHSRELKAPDLFRSSSTY
jgi:hypothetical protein